MIINIFGDSSRQEWLSFLPRPLVITSKYSGLTGDIHDPPFCGLALLAAVLREQPGKKYEKAIWNLRELSKEGEKRNGRNIDGDRMTEEDLKALENHPINDYLASLVQKKIEAPSTIIINPIADWWNKMVTHITHEDIQWARSEREIRINETLYWLQREVPVVLVSTQVLGVGNQRSYDPNLPSALERQCSLIIRVEQGKGFLVFQRDHVGISASIGGEVSKEGILEALGYISVR